jgi:hypothetical protein
MPMTAWTRRETNGGGEIFPVIRWWTVTQDWLINIDGATHGDASAIAAERRRRIEPVTGALNQLMASLGPALTANVMYRWKPDLPAIKEMIRLFAEYTLSVREFAGTVLPGMDLDLPDQRESARAQLQAATDDLEAVLTGSDLKGKWGSYAEWPKAALKSAEATLRNAATTPIRNLIEQEEFVLNCLEYIAKYRNTDMSPAAA